MSQIQCVLLSLLLGLRDAGDAPVYEFQETVLSNGLKVVTLEDWTCPIVAVQVWYHVGSKDEARDRQGFAHMFEHMMFRGTDRLGATDHFDLIRRTGGSCNGFTTFDHTTYVNVAPSNQLPLLLWLEAERLAALKIDAPGFETERRVVEEERRLGLNQPYGSVPEKLVSKVFRDHPYGWTPIGNIPHLRAATIEELQSFWDRFYVPNNATLVIVGAVRHAEAQKLAKTYFGWIPRCPDPPRVAAPDGLDRGPLEFTIEEARGPIPVVGVGYLVPPLGHPDGPALKVLSAVLGEGESSRLHRELIKKRRVATMALSSMYQLEQVGGLGAIAVLLPFGDTARAGAALQEELTRIREEGITEEELTKARNRLIKRLVTASLTVESKARLLGEAATILGGTEAANRDLERYRALTVEDVRRVAREYLVPERRVSVTVKPSVLGMIGSLFGNKKGKPEDEGAEAPAETNAARAKPGGPKATAVRPESLPEAPPIAPPLGTWPAVTRVEKRLENGLRVVVVSNHEVPFVTLLLGLLHGASSEDPETPGAASMACSMLTRGTAKHSADDLAEELDTYAIDIGGSADHDTATIRASAVAGEFERAMQYLSEVIQSPTFPQEEWETRRREILSGLMVSEKEPSYQADRQFERVVYGEHAYGRPAGGTTTDVRKLTREDLSNWWKTFARPDSAVLYVAGDVGPEDAFRVARNHFGAWKTRDRKPEVKPRSFPEGGKTRIYLVDLPGSYQSQIRVGHRTGILPSSPEHPASRVFNQIFGGSFGSRLNASLRVEKGLTYGIRGGFSSREKSGLFRISTFSKTPKTAEAVETILEEIHRLRTDAFTEDELGGARSYLTGSFARGRETPQSIVGDLWFLDSRGLPKDHFENYLHEVATCGVEEVMDVARSAVDADALVIVVVGEAGRIREDLEKIAPVTLIEKP